MNELKLSAQVREAGNPNHVRREGLVPAVVYGSKRSSQAVAVDGRELAQVLRRGINSLIRLSVAASEDTVMIKDIQRNPVRGNILHVDFLAVAMDELLKATVPLQITGDEQVSEHGGIVQHQLREIEVECLPGDLPGYLTVDISELRIGQHIAAGDLAIPETVTMLTGPSEVVITVVAPRVAEEEEEEEEDETLEGEPGEEPADEPGEEPK